MPSLLLKLRGPMQSWGHESRFTVRSTDTHPTKSGIVGLIAAAEGRRRSDPIEDLAELTLAVRIDQRGNIERDFQTAIDWRKGNSMPLVNRYYLTDAVFLVAIEAPIETLNGIEHALKHPLFPLYLGRKSCPANYDLVIGHRDAGAVAALKSEPWSASDQYKRQRPSRVRLPIFRDADAGEPGIRVQDVPVSFAQEHRIYRWRNVVQELSDEMENGLGRGTSDPFFETVIQA